MELINPPSPPSRRITLWGAPGAGKATTLAALAAAFGGRVESVVHPTTRDFSGIAFEPADQTLFLQLRDGPRRARVVVVTVPGAPRDASTTKLALQGVDAVVFVVDSDPARRAANGVAADLLRAQLQAQGFDPSVVPLVFQWNKRDLPGALPVPELRALLGAPDAPGIETVATRGEGVPRAFEAARALIQTRGGGGR